MVNFQDNFFYTVPHHFFGHIIFCGKKNKKYYFSRKNVGSFFTVILNLLKTFLQFFSSTIHYFIFIFEDELFLRKR